VRTWWHSLPTPRDRGGAFRLIASTAVGFVLFLLWAFHPAAAAGDELQVIAVHTASAPRVSMVVQPPATQPDDQSTETFSVAVDEDPVAATVTPMASDSLSVALVIDTASDLTAGELAAVQSGATEFLLRLPVGAHTMVVDAGGEPQIVAPLSEHAAEAVSAISALRTGGSANSKAGTRLAAEALRSAPPGPRVIIVYARGPGERDPLIEQLSEAVLQANAVVNVIQTSTDSLWPWVVDRTGGVILPPTGAADIAQSYGRLATMLSEQYLVTFQAPDELPAVAQVAFQSGDQDYTTVVNLPDSDPAQAAPTESSDGPPAGGMPWLIALLVAGLALTMLGVYLRRARHPQPADSGEPSTEVASPATGATPRDKAAAANAPRPQPADKAAPSAPAASLSDDPTPNGPPQPPSTSPAQPRPARKSLTAAVEGRRLARLTLDSQPESRPEPAEQRGQANNNHAQDPPTDPQAPYPAEGRNTASGSGAGTKSGKRRPENPAEGGQNPQPESR
jgi:von Willebrand factor type A domain